MYIQIQTLAGRLSPFVDNTSFLTYFWTRFANCPGVNQIRQMRTSRSITLLINGSHIVCALAMMTACNASGGSPTDGGKDTNDPLDVFTVASWNLEVLIDSFDDPDEFQDQRNRPSAGEYSSRLTQISSALMGRAPEIIAVQEIESDKVANELAQKLSDLTGRTYTAHMADTGENDVAILTTLPGLDVNNDGKPDQIAYDDEKFVRPIAMTTTTFARAPLEVFFKLGPGENISVFVVHFISKLGGDDERREGEGQRLRELVQARLDSGLVTAVVVAGDFNDTPESTTLSNVVEGGVLSDLTTSISQPDRWSFIFQSDNIQLDYMMIAGKLAFDPAVTFDHVPFDQSISDHAPLYATFTRLTR